MKINYLEGSEKIFRMGGVQIFNVTQEKKIQATAPLSTT